MSKFFYYCMSDPVAGASLGVVVGCCLLPFIYWAMDKLSERRSPASEE